MNTIAADLDLLAGLAAERLLDLQRQGASTSHQHLALAAQAAHGRLAAALAPAPQEADANG